MTILLVWEAEVAAGGGVRARARTGIQLLVVPPEAALQTSRSAVPNRNSTKMSHDHSAKERMLGSIHDLSSIGIAASVEPTEPKTRIRT